MAVSAHDEADLYRTLLDFTFEKSQDPKISGLDNGLEVKNLAQQKMIVSSQQHSANTQNQLSFHDLQNHSFMYNQPHINHNGMMGGSLFSKTFNNFQFQQQHLHPQGPQHHQVGEHNFFDDQLFSDLASVEKFDKFEPFPMFPNFNVNGNNINISHEEEHLELRQSNGDHLNFDDLKTPVHTSVSNTSSDTLSVFDLDSDSISSMGSLPFSIYSNHNENSHHEKSHKFHPGKMFNPHQFHNQFASFEPTEENIAPKPAKKRTYKPRAGSAAKLNKDEVQAKEKDGESKPRKYLKRKQSNTSTISEMPTPAEGVKEANEDVEGLLKDDISVSDSEADKDDLSKEGENDSSNLSLSKQKRTKWVLEEVQSLWEGISLFGNNWRQIKKRSFPHRTYYQVKDKGRRILATKGWSSGRTKATHDDAADEAKEIAKNVVDIVDVKV